MIILYKKLLTGINFFYRELHGIKKSTNLHGLSRIKIKINQPW